MSEPTKAPTSEKTLPERIARWDPVRTIEEMRGEMSRLWGEAWPFGPWTTATPLRRLLPAPTV